MGELAGLMTDHAVAAGLQLETFRSKAASEMLGNEYFRASWLRLYRECPWSTAAQSPAFVTSWYEAYQDKYTPLLICHFSPSGALAGFLPLGIHPSGQAVLPGAHQADYKSWLALPGDGGAFLKAGLEFLSRAKIKALEFRYLPPGTPIGGDVAWLRKLCIHGLETQTRPIVRLHSDDVVADYIRRKTSKIIKNRFNRLKRVGEMRLEQVRKSDDLLSIFDRLIEWYEIRQEAAHGKTPFRDDKFKKKWHLDLLEKGLLHVTLFKAGDNILSAIFGLSDGTTFSMMMPVFNPEFAQYSPIALHHLLLVKRLHEEGYSVLDLTPGSDAFKQRFADEYEEVQALSLYFRRREWIKARARQRGLAFAKSVISATGIAPSLLVRTLPRAIEFYSRFLSALTFRKAAAPRRAEIHREDNAIHEPEAVTMASVNPTTTPDGG